jgi:NADPH:quinone reductase-like Zn-dependent oxidoreductase
MKAVLVKKYGAADGLQLQEVETPVPEANEVRVRVHASTVTSGDVNLRSFRFPALFWLSMRLFYGIKKPKRLIPGSEFAGQVDAVGQQVKRFQVGEPVFGSAGMSFGANAEYLCLPEEGVVAGKPDDLSFTQAAAVPFGGLTALYFLRKGNIQRGSNVLINGASGSVGTAAVQLAKAFGAEVTGVCSTTNLELVSSLGANQVIDYTQVDFTETGARYDLIFDAVGKTSQDKSRKVLAPEGAFVTVQSGLVKDTREDLMLLKELVETGKFQPVVDRRYPLEQIAEAHRYVEKGHKKGNVVLVVTGDHKN